MIIADGAAAGNPKPLTNEVILGLWFRFLFFSFLHIFCIFCVFWQFRKRFNYTVQFVKGNTERGRTQYVNDG